jgi:tRNA A-37 threonylcarbamoyl transferase component Bud32
MARLRQHQMIGERFGSYKIVAALGKGAMGEVFLAEHLHIARRAAIKLLVPQLSDNYEVMHRFFVEARAMSMIQHPGIVEVFDCAVHPNGRAYIVMEYLEGETLAAELLRAGRLPWRRACAIAREIALALGAAHDRGVVHRDLKPENVFLCVDQRAGGEVAVKVLDFGVAKLFAAESLEAIHTRKGALLGTPAYMAPEQCAGRGEIDHRVDVYALGCMLFEMLTGRPPFHQAVLDAKGLNALALAHMHRPAPSPRLVAPDVPPWLDRLVIRLMAKQPHHRPASMGEVAEALTIPQGAKRPRDQGMGASQLAVAAAGLVVFPLMIVFGTRAWSAWQRTRDLASLEQTSPAISSTVAPPAAPAATERPPVVAAPVLDAPEEGEAPGKVEEPVAAALEADAAPAPPRRDSSSARRRIAAAPVTLAAPSVKPPRPADGAPTTDVDGIVDL